MAAARCANPIVLVEGLGGSSGEALAALTSMIDPRTSARWAEDAIGATVDLSQATWLVCARDMASLPLPLARLLRPIELREGDDEAWRDMILLGLVDEVAASFGVPPSRAATR